LIGIFNRFQKRKRGSAGAARAAVTFGCWSGALISCEIGQTKRSGRCARAERVEGGQKEAAVFIVGVEFDGE
jgi:hypothetical protein